MYTPLNDISGDICYVLLMSVGQPRNIDGLQVPVEETGPSLSRVSVLGLGASDWMVLFAGVGVAAALIFFL